MMDLLLASEYIKNSQNIAQIVYLLYDIFIQDVLMMLVS
jgi:hypothetical protein